MNLPKDVILCITNYLRIDEKNHLIWLCAASDRGGVRRQIISVAPRHLLPRIAIHAPRFLTKQRRIEAVQQESTIVLHDSFQPDLELYLIAIDSGCIRKYIRRLGNPEAIEAVAMTRSFC